MLHSCHAMQLQNHTQHWRGGGPPAAARSGFQGTSRMHLKRQDTFSLQSPSSSHSVTSHCTSDLHALRSYTCLVPSACLSHGFKAKYPCCGAQKAEHRAHVNLLKLDRFCLKRSTPLKLVNGSANKHCSTASAMDTCRMNCWFQLQELMQNEGAHHNSYLRVIGKHISISADEVVVVKVSSDLLQCSVPCDGI